MSARLVAWYRRHRRDLPWRTASEAQPDAYLVLVSESMLQQTQVATVIPYFLRFMEAFPRIHHLADADEQHVLRCWQGLGYYSRARKLRRAAQVVVRQFGGAIPADVEQLRTLPGVGRYTAGAIASLAFNRREPIVDGNVARVICRLDGIETDPRSAGTLALLWFRAAQILPKRAVGEFNSALMELGATVCTPRAPKCLVCPVQEHCQAFADGSQERIPLPRAAKPTPLVHRRAWCIRRVNGHGTQFLIEQRPGTGRWAKMWQFITRDVDDPAAPAGARSARLIGRVQHALTHRRYEFEVLLCDVDARPTRKPAAGKRRPRRWVRLDELDAYPLPRPQERIARMLRDHPCAPDPSARAESCEIRSA